MEIDDDNPQSSSGGAAANAGVEFQQRVAAWCLVIMHCKSDPKALLDLPETGPIIAVRFEARTFVDDLVLVTEKAGEVFVQIKRRVTLSDASDSDFVSTLEQFVRQYVAQHGTGYYILAVPSTASVTIRNTLRSLLDQLRLNSDAWKTNPLSKAEERCIAAHRAVVEKLYKARAGTEIDDGTMLAFSRRVFIREFALTPGMGHEIAALTLLGRDASVPPELIWAYLIAQSLRFAAERSSVTRDDLAQLIGPYFKPSPATPELAIKLAIKIDGIMPAGREVVVIEDFPKPKALAIVEFYRFELDGTRRLRFKGDRCIWASAPDGSRVLHRSATMDGMERWIDKHASAFGDRDVLLIPANDIEAEVHSPAAQIHGSLLEKIVSENESLLKCLHCGKPLSQAVMTLVEIDDDDTERAVGTVHDGCLRPIDRVLGQVKCPAFEGHEYLKKFDVDLWLQHRLHGQSAFYARIDAKLGGRCVVAWNKRNEQFRENSYCIEVTLSDGTTRHMTSRGLLDRYDLEEATKRAAFVNSHFRDAIIAGDPHCYTSVNFTYGPESLLLRIKEPEEALLECREARVVPYTVALGRRYERDSMFYAPLCRLVRADNEKPVLLGGCQLLLTNPFRLPELIRNWHNAGIELPDYEIRILETDNDIDRLFEELFAHGEQPIIDPICDRAGNLVAGYSIIDHSTMKNPWD